MKKITYTLMAAITLAISIIPIRGAANENLDMQLMNIIHAGGNVELARELIQRGAHVNVINDFFKESPLYAAVKQGNIDLVALLLANGAENTITPKHGETPLHLAVSMNNIDMIKLLLDHEFDINTKNRFVGNTPLHYAVINDNFDLVKLLLTYSPDDLIKNNYGQTPRDIAKARGYQNITDILTEYAHNFPITKGA